MVLSTEMHLYRYTTNTRDDDDYHNYMYDDEDTAHARLLTAT